MTVGLEYDDMQTWLSSLNCRLSFLPPHPGGINEYEVDLGYEEEIEVFARNHQFSASAVELEFLRSERRLRSGKHFA